jgi:hypothetical protein
MSSKFLFIISIHLSIISLAQPGPELTIDSLRPRNKIAFDKPGRYEAVIQLARTEINAGQPLEIAIFFSGYGEISGSKIFFSTAKGVLNPIGSYGMGSLRLNENNSLSIGADKETLSTPESFILSLKGIRMPKWENSSQYIDYSSAQSDSQNIEILPEWRTKSTSTSSGVPIYLHLNTFDSAEAGNYTITLVYTYFNGIEWAGSTQTASFRVRNILERNPLALWIISILGIVTVVGSTISWTYSFIKWLVKHIPKKKPEALKPTA